MSRLDQLKRTAPPLSSGVPAGNLDAKGEDGDLRASKLTYVVAEPLEAEWFGPLGVTVVGEDRTNLLCAVLDAISTVDGAIITGATGQVLGDFAFLNLVVEKPRNPGDLRCVAENIRRLKDHPPSGARGYVRDFVTLAVSGPDRPGLLRQVCGILANHGVNIRQFHLKPRIEVPESLDLDRALAAATAHFDFVFDAEFTRPIKTEWPDLQAEIVALSPAKDVQITRMKRGRGTENLRPL